MKKRVVILTTADNPFDFFDEQDLWRLYDLMNGYDCCGLLDRVAKTSESLTDYQNALEIERAIDDIVINDPTNTYKKVVKEVDE